MKRLKLNFSTIHATGFAQVEEKINEIVDLINLYDCTGGCGNWKPKDTVNKLIGEEKCPACMGKGSLDIPNDNLCYACNGSGVKHIVDANKMVSGDAPKPKSYGLEEVIDNFIEQASYSDLCNTKNLCSAIRQYIKETAPEGKDLNMSYNKESYERFRGHNNYRKELFTKFGITDA